MLWFDGAPAIPSNYARLRVLSAQEMALARAAAYVADAAADPSEPVRRAGLDNCTDPPPPDDMRDWRIRVLPVPARQSDPQRPRPHIVTQFSGRECRERWAL